MHVLLSENLTVSVHDVLGVLVEQIVNSDVEILMPLDGLGVMEDCAGEVAMLDVHVLESVSALLS